MAHAKVYGICENLCKVEVIAKEHIAVLTGTITMPEASSGTVTGYVEIDYPTGFSNTNCVVVGLMAHNTSHTDYWSTTMKATSQSTLLGNGDLVATLRSDKIKIMSNKAADEASRNDVTYKLVLMKVS